MATRAPHPLYLQVSEAHRWAGPLSELLPALRPRAWKLAARCNEQDRAADRDWAWVVLPGGAIVGLRIRGELGMRHEVRIARQEKPEAERATAAWEREVATFLRHFGIVELDGETPADPEGWWREPPHRNDVAKGIAAVRLIQLRAGEIRPGVARCHDCLLETGEIHEIEWMPGARIEGQRCMNHATAAGRRYVEQRLLERVR